MAAPKGNKFWLKRAKSGRDKIFSTPECLWEAACEYFQWIDETPLEGEKLFSFQGEVIKGDFKKMRAMTIDGLCLFLGVGKSTWSDYKARDDFSAIIEQVENVIRSQKFAGAAADLLNANIIARDLGLRDATTSEHTGPNGGPVHLIGTEMTATEATNLYKSIIDD
jgi:hypothetical protein